MSQGHVCLVQLMYATVIFRLNVMSEMACFQATTFNAHDNTVSRVQKNCARYTKNTKLINSLFNHYNSIM